MMHRSHEFRPKVDGRQTTPSGLHRGKNKQMSGGMAGELNEKQKPISCYGDRLQRMYCRR